METLFTVIATLAAAVVGGRYLLLAERKKNYVVPLGDGKIRVDFKALKRARGMWLIPDHGILNIERNHREEAEYQKWKVAFICRDTTPENDHVQQYTVERVVLTM